jgi:hypothetical protein
MDDQELTDRELTTQPFTFSLDPSYGIVKVDTVLL